MIVSQSMMYARILDQGKRYIEIREPPFFYLPGKEILIMQPNYQILYISMLLIRIRVKVRIKY